MTGCKAPPTAISSSSKFSIPIDCYRLMIACRDRDVTLEQIVAPVPRNLSRAGMKVGFPLPMVEGRHSDR